MTTTPASKENIQKLIEYLRSPQLERQFERDAQKALTQYRLIFGQEAYDELIRKLDKKSAGS